MIQRVLNGTISIVILPRAFCERAVLLRHGRTPQRAIIYTQLRAYLLCRLFVLFVLIFDIFGLVFRTAYFEQFKIDKTSVPACDDAATGSYHVFFAVWHVFPCVSAECFSGNSNDRFIRVGEVTDSIKCIRIHLCE